MEESYFNLKLALENTIYTPNGTEMLKAERNTLAIHARY